MTNKLSFAGLKSRPRPSRHPSPAFPTKSCHFKHFQSKFFKRRPKSNSSRCFHSRTHTGHFDLVGSLRFDLFGLGGLHFAFFLGFFPLFYSFFGIQSKRFKFTRFSRFWTFGNFGQTPFEYFGTLSLFKSS